MSGQHEIVDILMPPKFEPSGKTKTRHQAAEDGDWIGTFNTWLYRQHPEPHILYQQRSLKKDWEPGKLDVSAGGHYGAGELGLDGLRELKEELGIEVPAEHADLWGKRIYVGLDASGRERRHVVSVYTALFNGELHNLSLDDEEIAGAFWVPAKPLADLFNDVIECIDVDGIEVSGKPAKKRITIDSFPYNSDNYHQRMAEHIAVKFESS